MSLKEAIEGESFSFEGREFQCLGAMLLIDSALERATKKSLLAPLVWYLCVALSKRDVTPLGSRFLDSLKQNILNLCSNRSSILRMANLAKSGSVWEIGFLLAVMILTKLF